MIKDSEDIIILRRTKLEKRLMEVKDTGRFLPIRLQVLFTQVVNDISWKLPEELWFDTSQLSSRGSVFNGAPLILTKENLLKALKEHDKNI